LNSIQATLSRKILDTEGGKLTPEATEWNNAQLSGRKLITINRVENSIP